MDTFNSYKFCSESGGTVTITDKTMIQNHTAIKYCEVTNSKNDDLRVFFSGEENCFCTYMMSFGAEDCHLDSLIDNLPYLRYDGEQVFIDDIDIDE